MIFLMLLGLLQSTYTDLPPECNSLHSSSSPLSSWFVRFWSAGALFGRSANGCRAPTDWVDFFPLPPLPSSPRSAFVSLVGLLFSLQYFGAFWFPCGCDSARVLALFFFSERGREREDGRQVGSLSLHECRGERLGYPRMGAHTHPPTHTHTRTTRTRTPLFLDHRCGRPAFPSLLLSHHTHLLRCRSFPSTTPWYPSPFSLFLAFRSSCDGTAKPSETAVLGAVSIEVFVQYAYVNVRECECVRCWLFFPYAPLFTLCDGLSSLGRGRVFYSSLSCSLSLLFLCVRVCVAFPFAHL